MCAPVVLFSYNRPDKTQNCLNSLYECKGKDKTVLYLFLDGPRSEKDVGKIAEVEKILTDFSVNGGFKKTNIIKSEKNKGLKRSIIEGVTKILDDNGKVIVLEDDLVVAPDFLLYMNEGLDYYEHKKRYGSVCANTYPVRQLKKYNKDVFVTRKGDCWGWGTWKDRWEGVDWTFADSREYRRNILKRFCFGRLESGLDKLLMRQADGAGSSWAVLWIYSLYNRELVSVYPKVCRAANVGNDGTGEHGGTEDKYKVTLSDIDTSRIFEDLPVNLHLERVLAGYPGRHLKDVPGMIKRRVARIIAGNR